MGIGGQQSNRIDHVSYQQFTTNSFLQLSAFTSSVQQWPFFAHLGTKVLVSSGWKWNGPAKHTTEVEDLKSGKIFSISPLGGRNGGAIGDQN